MDVNRIITELEEERDRLSRAIDALKEGGSGLGSSSGSMGGARSASDGRRKGLTPAGRRRLSELMKKRWAERRRRSA